MSSVMAHEDRQTTRGPGSRLGYAIVLLGAALFVVACFLPYYGYSIPPPPGETVSLYQAMTSGPDGGGSDLGAVLYLFGGVTPIAAAAIIGLGRGGRRTGLPLVLLGAIAAWSLTWIGALVRLGTFGTSLDIGFWLQVVSIGVAIIGTVLVVTRPTGAHERGARVSHDVGTSP
jgi:hypothetical protein